MRSSLTLMVLVLLTGVSWAQEAPTAGAEQIWEYWRQGKVRAARALADGLLANEPGDPRARYVQTLTSFVMQRYDEGLRQYELIDPEYDHRGELTTLVLDAYQRLGRFEDAVRFAEKMSVPTEQRDWIARRGRHPLSVELETVTVIPFAEENPFEHYMPAIHIEINGATFMAHLDTGGTHVAMSPETAERLGIEVSTIGTGIANLQRTDISAGLIEKLRMGDAVFFNVPVLSLSALTDVLPADAESGSEAAGLIIVGTNMLEPFLVTWDNQENRLILSRRGDEKSRQQHLKLIPADGKRVAFYMYYDHVMFAAGGVAEIPALVFHIDPGLIRRDAHGRQYALSAEPSVLREWGLEPNTSSAPFVACPGSLSLGPVAQDGHTIQVARGEGIREWHGLAVQATLGHGFTKNFIWTIDFDDLEYSLREFTRPETANKQVTSERESLSDYVGQYDIAPGVAVSVSLLDNGLYLQAPGQNKVPLTHQSKDVFMIMGVVKVEFFRAGTGLVTNLVLHQQGRETPARKVN